MDQAAKTRFQQVVPLHAPSLPLCWVPCATDKRIKSHSVHLLPQQVLVSTPPSSLPEASRCWSAEIAALPAHCRGFQEPAKQRSQWERDQRAPWAKGKEKGRLAEEGHTNTQKYQMVPSGDFLGGIHCGNSDELELEMGGRKPSNKWCVLCK